MATTSRFFATLVALSTLLLISCSQRTTYSGGGPVVSDCLSGSVTIPNLQGGTVKVGQAVLVQVQASGCKGIYRASRISNPSVTVNFSNNPGLFSATYSQAASAYSEMVKVDALDSSGKVVDTATFSSSVFSIVSAPSFSCTATPNTTSAAVSVSPTGVVTPVNFVFAINASNAANLTEVKLNGSTVSGLSLPLILNLQNSISIPVNTVGQQNFSFSATSTGSEFSSPATASCSSVVTTTAQQISLPQITSFSASNSQPTVGSPITLSLSVSNATSATIDGNAVSLSNGTASLSVTPPNSGSKSYIATATGPGGTVSQTILVSVKPSCEMSSTSSSVSVGSPYPIRVKISGNFSNAVMTVNGLTPLSVAGSSAGIDQTFDLNVLLASGVQTGTLYVYGPDDTMGSCAISLNMTAAATLISLKVNNVDAASVNVYVRSDVQFSWAFQGVNVCYDVLNRPLAPSGMFVFADIRSDQKFPVNCLLPNGTWQYKEIVAKVTGRWFQANLQICSTACSSLGLTNVADGQGMKCASGEQRPAALNSQTLQPPVYSYGCTNTTCSAISGNSNNASVGSYCYATNQTRDYDPTDATVACYCR